MHEWKNPEVVPLRKIVAQLEISNCIAFASLPDDKRKQLASYFEKRRGDKLLTEWHNLLE